MAKNYFGTKLLATALATFALASCQSESTLLEPSSGNYREVKLSGTVSKGALTRTNLNLTDDQKALFLTWNLGDKIHVCEADGNYVGFLKVTEFANEEQTLAKFEGTVRLIDTDGTQNLHFSYLGKDYNYSLLFGQPMTDAAYNFENQVNAGVPELAKNDLLLAEAPVEVKGGNATFVDLLMERQFAYGRFTLLYNDEPLTFNGDTQIFINTDANDIKTAASLAFPKEITASGSSSISLTTAENDFYVTFVPGSSESKIKFNVIINGEEYEGYSNTYLIEKNDFYRKAAGLDKAEALPINVKFVDGRDEKSYKLNYHSNYEGSTEVYTAEKTYTQATEEFEVKDYMMTEREGYTFAGWYDNAECTGEPVAVGSTVTLTYPNMETNLYAKWTESEYTWTVTWKDGYSDDPVKKQQTYTGKDGLDISGEYPSDPTREGWKFMGWAPQVSTLDKSVSSYEIVGQWKQLYSVNWYDGYTTPEKPINEKPVYVEDPTNIPSNVTPPAPTRPGFTFAGWDKVVDNENKTVKITAKWNQVTYDYTLNFADDADNIAGTETFDKTVDNPFTVAIDEKFNTYYQNKTGYKQIGWNTAKGATTALPSVEFTDKKLVITLYPVWEQLPDPNTVATPGYTHDTFN